MEAVRVDIRTGHNDATTNVVQAGELLEIDAGDTIFVTEVQQSMGYVRGWMTAGKLKGEHVYVPAACVVLQPN
jgi:hypothetical protein